jgi:hypothetical protein
MIRTDLLHFRNQSNSCYWARQHGLVVSRNDGRYADRRWDYDASMLEKPKHMKKLLYGAREKHPAATWKTSEVSEAYMFYGQ